MDTSVKQTVGSVPLLSILKRFDCIIKFYKFDKLKVKNTVHKRADWPSIALLNLFLF